MSNSADSADSAEPPSPPPTDLDTERSTLIDAADEAPRSASPAASPRVLLTVEQAAAALAIGRTNMFKLIKAGQIASVRVGQLRRIPAAEIDAYVARLLAEQNAA